MRFLLFPLAVFAGALALAQAPQSELDKRNVLMVTGDMEVATVNGKKITAEQFQALTHNLPEGAKNLAATQPQKFLEEYGYAMALLGEAEAAKLDQRSPYKDKLQEARRQLLTQAILAERRDRAAVAPEAVKAAYEAGREGFKEARVKVIFVTRAQFAASMQGGPAKALTTPEETEKKAQAAARRAKAGEDFVKLAKEVSDDRNTAENGADLAFPIRANGSNVPQHIRDAVLAAKKGEVVGPLAHDSGWYIFRVESAGIPEFEAVKTEIETQMKEAIVQKWLASVRSKVVVSMDNEPFWTAFVKLNTPAAKESGKTGAK